MPAEAQVAQRAARFERMPARAPFVLTLSLRIDERRNDVERQRIKISVQRSLLCVMRDREQATSVLDLSGARARMQALDLQLPMIADCIRHPRDIDVSAVRGLDCSRRHRE